MAETTRTTDEAMVEQDDAVAAHEEGEERAEASEVKRDAEEDATPSAR